MANVEYKRVMIKNGIGVPTIPPSTSHDMGDWIATDIYEDELYMENVTRKLYTRVGNSIILLGVARPSTAIAFAGCVGDNPPTENDGDVYVLIKEVSSPLMDVDTIQFQAGTTHGVRYNFNEFSMMTDGAVAVGDYFHASGAVNPVHDGSFVITAFDDITGWIQVNNPNVSSAADDEASDSTAIAHFTKAAWDGAQINDIAQFEASTGLWHHFTPAPGETIFITDDNAEYTFDSVAWVNAGYWTQDATNLSTAAQRHVLPLNTNTQNLGSATKRWKDAFIEGSILSNASFRLSTARSIPTPDLNNNWANPGDPYLGAWNIGLAPNFGEFVTEGADIYQNISGANSAVLPSLDGGSNWNLYDTNYVGAWSSGGTFAQGEYTDYSGFLYFHITALQETFKEMYFDGTTFFFRTNSATWAKLDSTKLALARIEDIAGNLAVVCSSLLVLQGQSFGLSATNQGSISAGTFLTIGVDSNDEIWIQDNSASDVVNSTTDKKAVIIGSYGSTTKQNQKNTVIIGGQGAVAEHWSETVFGNTYNAQSGKVAYYVHTNTNTPTEMALNDLATKYFNIPAGCSYYVTVKGIATNQITGESVIFFGEGIIKNLAGTTSTPGITITQLQFEGTMNTCVLAVTADDANDRMAVTFTGQSGNDIRCNVAVDYVKLIFA